MIQSQSLSKDTLVNTCP